MIFFFGMVLEQKGSQTHTNTSPKLLGLSRTSTSQGALMIFIVLAGTLFNQEATMR